MSEVENIFGDKIVEDDVFGASSPPDVKAEPEKETTDPTAKVEAKVETKVETKGEAPGDAESEAKATPDGEDADPTDAEMAEYPNRTQKRIKTLLAQRDEARGAATTAQQAADYSKPITEFMHKNDIPMEDMDIVLGLTAQLRQGNFSGFLEGIQPYIDLAMQYTGQVLPEDLQTQVNQGYVSQEVASELASRRAQGAWQEQANQRNQQQQREQTVNAVADTIKMAVTNWETQIRQTDPDYSLKADLVQRNSRALIQQNGPPQTPEVALAYAKKAYEDANQQIARFQPKPKATQLSPNSVHQASTTPVAEPSSMLEAVEIALRNEG